ncbi:MAG: hypothetical protein KKD39_03380 [Candidatus Altiarchaeota archaeon]|nr:hypothetical protein [Candidatus Altiarchaeota archaeon]
MKLILAGLLLGALFGASAYSAGVTHSCPSKHCIDSSKITPVTDKAYFDAACGLIKSARKTIYVMAFEVKYYVKNPESRQNKLVRELIYAKERGVEVRVLVDEYSKENNALDVLLENGVDIKYDGQIQTTHAKLLIVDGEKILLGSTNLSFFGLEKNHEANILVEDYKTAYYYTDYFNKIWDET